MKVDFKKNVDYPGPSVSYSFPNSLKKQELVDFTNAPFMHSKNGYSQIGFSVHPDFEIYGVPTSFDSLQYLKPGGVSLPFLIARSQIIQDEDDSGEKGHLSFGIYFFVQDSTYSKFMPLIQTGFIEFPKHDSKSNYPNSGIVRFGSSKSVNVIILPGPTFTDVQQQVAELQKYGIHDSLYRRDGPILPFWQLGLNFAKGGDIIKYSHSSSTQLSFLGFCVTK